MTTTVENETPAELIELREKRRSVQEAHNLLRAERDTHAAARDAAVAAADPAAVTRHSGKVAKLDDDLAGYLAVIDDLTRQAAPLEEQEQRRIFHQRNKDRLAKLLAEVERTEKDLNAVLPMLAKAAEEALALAIAAMTLQGAWQEAAGEHAQLQSLLNGDPIGVANLNRDRAAEDRVGKLMGASPAVAIAVRNREFGRPLSELLPN